MKIITFFCSVMTCLLLLSCKKEIFQTESNLSTISNEKFSSAVIKETKWQGAFLSGNNLPPSFSISDKYFINNGYARIYSNLIKVSKQNYYSTKFWLVIPPSVNIKGDSLNFEAGVKNPSNSAFYSPFYGRDITLYIKGETNEASITNVATADINPAAQQRAAIQLGQTVKDNIPELQYNFEDYDTLILQTFNRGVVAYRNNTYLNGLAYASDERKEQLIGRLKEIGIVFKGSGYVNYIKIYNSVNGKLLLSENFNTNGQSTVIIY